MDSPNERAVGIVRDCLNCLLRKTSAVQKYSVQQESYSRWAAREILTRLRKNDDVPPLVTIEQFRDEMERYSCVNIRTSYVFSCAKDMAEWIIDLLVS